MTYAAVAVGGMSLLGGLSSSKSSKKTPEGKAAFTTPSESQFQKTFHTLSEVQTQLNTRLEQMRQEYFWNKDPLPKQSREDN